MQRGRGRARLQGRGGRYVLHSLFLRSDSLRPSVTKPNTNKPVVVFVGSSVCQGSRATNNKGWSWHLAQYLVSKGCVIHNLTAGGATPIGVKQNLPKVEALSPTLVIVGLGLWNSVSSGDTPQNFIKELTEVVETIKNMGAMPMVGGVYPNNNYTPEAYEDLLWTEKEISKLGVSVFPFLNATDDGKGHWKEGLYFNAGHPNDEGHKQMFKAIDLTVFDPYLSPSTTTTKVQTPKKGKDSGPVVPENLGDISEGVVPFWKPNGDGAIYSQWYMRPMVIDGVVYNCCEQYMMAMKARIFGDKEMEDEIMNCRNPALHQKFGKKVRNFDSAVWDSVAQEIVYQGNLAKFSQYEELKQELLATGKKVLVEASPMDKRWGVGLHPTDPRVAFPKQWCGYNYLGFAIMRVRETLNKQNS